MAYGSTGRLPTVLFAVFLVLGLLAGCVVVTERDRRPRDGDGGDGPPSGESYNFLHRRGGEPVRWSICEPIRYVVRPANQPKGADRLLEESIDRISEVTGLKFSFEGTTDEAPRRRRPIYQPNRYGDQWAPVLIAYSNPAEDKRLQGGAVGFGGPALVSATGRQPRYVSGAAVFDVQQIERSGMADDVLRAVMLHELAHVVGLGHVNDRNQLMNPAQYGRSVTTLQEGDIAGLKALGMGECYKPIQPSSLQRSN